VADDAEKPGSFRRHEIATLAGGMKPPTFPLVPAMLGGLVDRVNQIGADLRAGRFAGLDGPVLMAECHGEFERIHPFLDGNGRTGRLVVNLIMVRLGWPPVVILKSKRRHYLAALTRSDSGDAGPLAEMIARGAIASMNTLLPTMAGATGLLPLSALAAPTVSLAALRQAAVRGRLEARLDQHGQWHSTAHAVEGYLATRYQRQ
jgi:hypothetical protein